MFHNDRSKRVETVDDNKVVNARGLAYQLCRRRGARGTRVAHQERLDELRKTQIANKETPRYDGRCLNLTEEEIQAKLAAGEPYVVRLKVPTKGVCIFEDELRGEVSIDWKQIDHQILQKSIS